jgi:hypothetical protein
VDSEPSPAAAAKLLNATPLSSRASTYLHNSSSQAERLVSVAVLSIVSTITHFSALDEREVKTRKKQICPRGRERLVQTAVENYT